MVISLSPESAIKQAGAIQNEFKQPNEAVWKIEQKLHWEIRVQSVFDATIYTIQKRVHSLIKNFFVVAKLRDTKFTEKKPSHSYPSSILPQ